MNNLQKYATCVFFFVCFDYHTLNTDKLSHLKVQKHVSATTCQPQQKTMCRDHGIDDARGPECAAPAARAKCSDVVLECSAE